MPYARVSKHHLSVASYGSAGKQLDELSEEETAEDRQLKCRMVSQQDGTDAEAHEAPLMSQGHSRAPLHSLASLFWLEQSLMHRFLSCRDAVGVPLPVPADRRRHCVSDHSAGVSFPFRFIGGKGADLGCGRLRRELGLQRERDKAAARMFAKLLRLCSLSLTRLFLLLLVCSNSMAQTASKHIRFRSRTTCVSRASARRI